MTPTDVPTRPGAEPGILTRLPGWSTAGAGAGAGAGSRLARLYVASRRVPAALAVLVGCSVVLRAALEWQWIPSSGRLAQQLPVLLEAGAASVIAVTTYSPLGEPERATGRWLPYLRFGTAAALTAIAVGLLSAGAAAAKLPGGTPDVARNVAGMTGIGLLSAAVIGAGLSWIGPMVYLVLSEYAIFNDWRNPWIWPDRPPHDLGATLCATLAFVAGVALVTARGARQCAVE